MLARLFFISKNKVHKFYKKTKCSSLTMIHKRQKENFVTKDWVIKFTLWIITILGILSVALFVINLVNNIQLQKRVDNIQEILNNAEVVTLDY